MTIISSSIEGILDGVIKEDQVKNYLVVISDEIKRLSKVVTSMNNLTKITSGQMKLSKQKINISEMIRQAIFNFEIQILNKNIKIFGLDKRDLFVIGDSDMIYQVIYNLIENAVKFVDQNGYIKIKYKETQELVYIGIKNSGEGISENDIKYICDKFYKVDKSRSQDKSGVGLGLYLVRQILRLHESDLEIESVKDKYTQFFFWLEKNK
ncbi:MAG: GHKL domain-containing protein [Oscillospiraceae bacterium]|nr:GHKL domain-containing protein [Oscillospiraceae bacterium]